jgi:hypothetical protein
MQREKRGRVKKKVQRQRKAKRRKKWSCELYSY